MRLTRRLANLGYGSQKQVKAMIQAGRVTDLDGTELTAEASTAHEAILFDGKPLDPAPGFVLMMNKPLDYTCSTNDPGRIIYELLPPRFIYRKPIVSPVGRLDRDASGLLLLTDDGDVLHRVISPRSTIAKTYRVELERPLRGDEGVLFASGTLMLRSEDKPLLPAKLTPIDEMSAFISIVEGRYHQVRRMFAATGNHVKALQRTQIGGLDLGDLPSGNWRTLSKDELDLVFTEKT